MGQFEFSVPWNQGMRLPDFGNAVPWEYQGASGIAGSMSLVIAARAIDGVVLASDSRETIPPAVPSDSFSNRDDQPKLFEASGFGIGVAGAGHWVGSLVGPATRTAMSSLGVAEALRAAIIEQQNFPPVTCLCIRSGEPIGIVNGVGQRGAVTWEAPTVLSDSWRCSGIVPVANSLMSTFWTPSLTTLQVASLCAVAIAASAVYCFIGGPTQIIALRDDGKPWADAERRAALQGARDWFNQARRLFSAIPGALHVPQATEPDP